MWTGCDINTVTMEVGGGRDTPCVWVGKIPPIPFVSPAKISRKAKPLPDRVPSVHSGGKREARINKFNH